MPYQPILATLGYVFSPDGGAVLMVHRIARPDDPHYGKFNGLGGKLERDEDIVSGMRREIREEAGIDCTVLSLCGTVSWPGFGKQGEDWFGFIFRITGWQGEPRPTSPEGPLVWVPREQVMSLQLWDGDRYFLPAVLDDHARPFHGVMPYENGRPLGWSVSTL
ncbi:MAG: 8-oxo-dGTP diphosphatase [Bacteroidales bacterium]|nr:8-oxo-dGTP diphosphatase [Bacteroidales bacterium]